MDGLYYILGIYILFFILLFGNYGGFAVTVRRWAKSPDMEPGDTKVKQPEMSVSEIIPCYIPFYQACIVRRTLYGSCLGTAIFCILSFLGIAGNLVNKFLFPINGYVMFVFNIVMLVSVVMFILIYSIVTADCARTYNFNWFNIILCFILPHLWCWYLRNNIPNKMRAMYKEDVFNEHQTEVIIRQKHS